MKSSRTTHSNFKKLPALLGLGVFLFSLSCITGGCGGSLEPRSDFYDQTRFKIEQLRAQPVGKGNVRVNIQRLEITEKKRQLSSVLLRYRDKNATVSAGRLGGRNGLFLYGLKEDWQAGWRLEAQKSRSARQSRQFLVLMVGTRGAISLTQHRSQPVLVEIPVYDGTALAYTIREEITGTGLDVHVVSTGPEGVLLELMPYFHARRKHGRIEVEKLATRILLKPGQPCVIGGQRTRKQSLGSGLFRLESRESTGETAIVLSVDTAKE